MTGRGTEHYDSEYRRTADELYTEIRREAFGEEIGQYSWLTADEYRTFFGWLGIDTSSHVLEIASGSGGPAIFMAEETGCRVTGADIHEAGVAAALTRAVERGLADRAVVRVHRCTRATPVRDRVVRRAHVHRLDQPSLRAGARLRRVASSAAARRAHALHRPDRRDREAPSRGDEHAQRFDGRVRLHSAGCRRAARARSGFRGRSDRGCDTEHGGRARAVEAAAREQHRDELVEAEGADEYAAFQHFLAVVGSLARERRLSRVAVVATRP